MKQTLRTWGRLLRVPNLFTVPGDPLAGFLLASGGVLAWRAAGAAGAALLLYAAGLLLNDWFDRAVDAEERPERPIPSGAVRPRTVLGAGIACLAGGVALAWGAGGPTAGVVAAALAVCVVAYDGVVNRRWWGCKSVMGACRGGSVLLGAAFAGNVAAAPVLVAAVVAWAYTTSVTMLAADEATERQVGRAAYTPALVLLAGGAAMTVALPRPPFVAAVALLALGVAAGEAAVVAYRATHGQMPTPAFIGRLIRVMILSQAAWCVWPLSTDALPSAFMPALAAVLVIRLAADLAAERFYGS